MGVLRLITAGFVTLGAGAGSVIGHNFAKKNKKHEIRSTALGATLGAFAVSASPCIVLGMLIHTAHKFANGNADMMILNEGNTKTYRLTTENNAKPTNAESDNATKE
jgi:Na+-driven multidrug efflux pump